MRILGIGVDIVEIARLDAAFREHVARGAPRERGVELLEREPLLGGSGDGAPVHDERRSGVAVEGAEPEDPPPYCERKSER